MMTLCVMKKHILLWICLNSKLVYLILNISISIIILSTLQVDWNNAVMNKLQSGRLSPLKGGAGKMSFVVLALDISMENVFAHGAMGHQIDPSWWTH